MPYRDRAHVQRWIDEYLRAFPHFEGRVEVLDEGFDPRSEISIVTVSLRSSAAITYLQATLVNGAPRWNAVFEGSDEPVSMDESDLKQFAQDSADMSTLCSWLQRCTDDAMRSPDPNCSMS